MVITDPIVDMFTRIRNAGSAGKTLVYVPYSSLKLRIAQVLLKAGYIASIAHKTLKEGKSSMRAIEIGVEYDPPSEAGASRVPRLRGVERTSRPSRRRYIGVKDIHSIRQGSGIMLLSTPKGILTGDAARKEHVGGEIICKVW